MPTHQICDVTDKQVNWRRVGVYLIVTFGVSWATGLVVFLLGGIRDPQTVAFGLTAWTLLIPTFYMFGPAIGHVVVRLWAGEGLRDPVLRPRVRAHWRSYALAWVVPPALTFVGLILYFAVFPGQFDASLSSLRGLLKSTGVTLDPAVLLTIQTVFAVVLGPLLNAIPAFGEEYGWRGFLYPELTPLGERRALLLHGVIWGVWHWPVIALGYEYGFGYPGFPWVGFLVFLPFTVGVGSLLAWLRARSGSVWPAAIGHGSVNAVAAVGIYLVAGQPRMLLGPTPVGLVAVLPWLALVAWLLYHDDRLRICG